MSFLSLPIDILVIIFTMTRQLMTMSTICVFMSTVVKQALPIVYKSYRPKKIYDQVFIKYDFIRKLNLFRTDSFHRCHVSLLLSSDEKSIYENAIHLTSLKISSDFIHHSLIYSLSNLTKLTIRNVNVEMLKTIERMNNLRYLNVHRRSLNYFTPMNFRELCNLQYLQTYDINISYNTLSFLTNLTELSIFTDDIYNYDGDEFVLPSLKSLKASRNLCWLAGTNLTTLQTGLGNNPSILKRYPNLKELRFSCQQNCDDILVSLTNLQSLCVDAPISIIKNCLSQMTNLTSLSIPNCYNSGCEIDKLTNLTYLNIFGCNSITNEMIYKLTKLQHLRLALSSVKYVDEIHDHLKYARIYY